MADEQGEGVIAFGDEVDITETTVVVNEEAAVPRRDTTTKSNNNNNSDTKRTPKVSNYGNKLTRLVLILPDSVSDRHGNDECRDELVSNKFEVFKMRIPEQTPKLFNISDSQLELFGQNRLCQSVSEVKQCHPHCMSRPCQCKFKGKEKHSGRHNNNRSYCRGGHDHSRSRSRQGRLQTRGRGDRSRSRGRCDRSRSRGRYDRSRSRGRYDRSQSRGRYDRSQSRGRHSRSQSRGRCDRSRSRGRYDRSRSRGRHDRLKSRGRRGCSQSKGKGNCNSNPPHSHVYKHLYQNQHEYPYKGPHKGNSSMDIPGKEKFSDRSSDHEKSKEKCRKPVQHKQDRSSHCVKSRSKSNNHLKQNSCRNRKQQCCYSSSSSSRSSSSSSSDSGGECAYQSSTIFIFDEIADAEAVTKCQSSEMDRSFDKYCLDTNYTNGNDGITLEGVNRHVTENETEDDVTMDV